MTNYFSEPAAAGPTNSHIFTDQPPVRPTPSHSQPHSSVSSNISSNLADLAICPSGHLAIPAMVPSAPGNVPSGGGRGQVQLRADSVPPNNNRTSFVANSCFSSLVSGLDLSGYDQSGYRKIVSKWQDNGSKSTMKNTNVFDVFTGFHSATKALSILTNTTLPTSFVSEQDLDARGFCNLCRLQESDHATRHVP